MFTYLYLCIPVRRTIAIPLHTYLYLKPYVYLSIPMYPCAAYRCYPRSRVVCVGGGVCRWWRVSVVACVGDVCWWCVMVVCVGGVWYTHINVPICIPAYLAELLYARCPLITRQM